MKTWTNVEKAFQDAGIDYEQKDWIFWCEIESGKFYYSPQSGKWRVKQTRVWRGSNSVEDFITVAKEYIRAKKEAKQSVKSQQKSNQRRKKKKKKSQKTKASRSKSPQKTSHKRNYQRRSQKLKDEVRPEFLELFDEKIRICQERNYKPAWIWKLLLDKYLLTPKEICWLCTVFDYAPGWAFHQAKEQYRELTYQKILALIGDNRSEWLKYFNSRWQFSFRNESREKNHRQRQDDQGQKEDHWSTQSDDRGERYQNYLDILQLKFPFSRQELKIAYRQKALKTHPDIGGTTEAFRKVNMALEILSPLAS